MRINRVHLENYRVHEVLDIEFSSGINLLLGENGRGKSSILEAIGYALFDSGLRTNNQKEAIKYGKKSAKIEVEFVGIDGEEYKVVRKIPGTTQLFRGEEVLDGRVEKIKELCGIKGEMKDIYDNVIVAKQNEFIVAFKEKSSEREKIFNKVFNTDIYAKIYEGYSRDVASKYERELELVNNNVQNISETLLDSKELKESIEFQEENLKVQREYEKLLEEKLKNVKEDIKRVEELEIDIKQTKILKETLDRNILDKELERENTELYLKESEIAIKVVEENREKFEEFQNLSKQLLELKERRKEVEKAREIYLNYERNRSRVEFDISKLEGDKEVLKSKISNYQKSKDEKCRLLEEKGEESSKKRELAHRCKQNIERIEPILKYALEFEEKIEKANQTLENQRGRAEEKKEEIERVERELSTLEREELAQKMKALELKERELRDLEGKNRILKTQYEENREAFKLLSSAMCPYLKESCENLKGRDVGVFFREKLEGIEAKRKSNTARLERLSQELVEKERVQNEIYRYEELKKSVEVKKNELINEKLKIENREMRYELALKEYEKYRIEKDFLNSEELGKLKLSYEVQLGNLELEKYEQELKKIAEEIVKLEGEIQKALESSEGIQKKIKEFETELVTIKSYLDMNRDVEERFKEADLRVQNLEEELKELEKAKELYIVNYKKAQEKEKYIQALSGIEKKIELDRKSVEKSIELLHELEEKKLSYNMSELIDDEGQLNTELKVSREKIGNISSEINYAKQRLEEAKKRELRLKEEREKIERLKAKIQLTKFFREKIKNMGKEVAKNMLKEIELLATENFRKITGRGEKIIWSNEDKDRYLVYLLGERGDLKFEQLSGGEQVAVAISIRGAMSEIFTDSKFSIFDEPTNNLDTERRRSLADSIGEILKNLDQSIIVTHDDTFREMAQRVIEL